VRGLRHLRHVGKAAVDVLLPGKPLLADVGHADHDEGRHHGGRQPAVVQHHRPIGLDLPGQHPAHELRARGGAEHVHQLLGGLAHGALQARALARRVELDQIDKGIAVHAVQQAQQTHLARLAPQRQRARHAHQVMTEGAGLVPVLAHAARQHDGQHRRQLGVPRQPVVVQQALGAGKQVGVEALEGRRLGHGRTDQKSAVRRGPRQYRQSAPAALAQGHAAGAGGKA
jgi:hypothetical protein